MSLRVQYITDQKGHKNAVLVAITDWEKIQKDLEELEYLRKQPKKKLSERLRGAIPKETAQQMQVELEQMRSEWQQRNI
jgi:PHD/YefM family antitoxin component YafN of YafNO toxin-antitoxin module